MILAVLALGIVAGQLLGWLLDAEVQDQPRMRR